MKKVFFFVAIIMVVFGFECQAQRKSTVTSTAGATIVRLEETRTTSEVNLITNLDSSEVKIIKLDVNTKVYIVDFTRPYKGVTVIYNGKVGYCHPSAFNTELMADYRRQDEIQNYVKARVRPEVGFPVARILDILGKPLEVERMQFSLNKEKWYYEDQTIYLRDGVVDIIQQVN